MPLKPTRPREAIRKLLKSRIFPNPTKVSHSRFTDGKGHFVTVPIHTKDIPLEALKSILKQSGISEREWDKL